MARVLFVQTIFFNYMGIMQLSSILKRAGHKVDVAVGPEGHMLKKVFKFKPDIIGFTAFSFEKNIVLRNVDRLRRAGGDSIKIIVGGPLGTFYPEVIEEGDIDAVCIGEGEGAMLEYAEMIERGEERTDIQNLHIRHKGEIIKNPLRPLIEDLDSLPWIDRNIYHDYPTIGRIPYIPIMAGRGCPFNCSYCCNSYLHDLYKGKGRYVRWRSVGNIIDELILLKKRESGKSVWFQDDIFPHDTDWLREFIDTYDRLIGLPVLIQSRFDIFKEEVAEIFSKWRSLRSVNFGIESGVEAIRTGLLKRRISDEDILKGVKLLKKYKLKYQCLNMLGLPGETIEDGMKTIRMNQMADPTTLMFTVFHPIPKTELAQYCVDQGYAREECLQKPYFFTHGESSLEGKDIRSLANLHKLSFVAVRYPFLNPFLKYIVQLPSNPIFYLIHRVTYLKNYRDFIGIRFPRVMEEGLIAFLYYHR